MVFATLDFRVVKAINTKRIVLWCLQLVNHCVISVAVKGQIKLQWPSYVLHYN